MKPMEDADRPSTARELLVGLSSLAGALVVNYYAGHLADRQGEAASVSPDLLLGRLPHWDTSPLFIYGFTIFLAWLVFAGVWRESRRSGRILWVYAVLVAVRSFFIILTPMRTPTGAVFVANDPLFAVIGRYITFKHDLFFSSHTALPFLAFLVFRDPWVKASFLVISFVMAATVLIGRFHYSIDVFAAFFITYAVHKLLKKRGRFIYRLLTGVDRD